MPQTVTRLYNSEISSQNIIDWAQRVLTAEELNDFNSAMQRNTQRYNSLKANNLIQETPIFEQFYSNTLQSNISLAVGDLVTYYVTNENLDQFQLDARWDYYLGRYIAQST